MSLKPFIVKDKKSNVVRIVKAETRTQVSRYLAQSFEIEQASALDVMEVMGNGNVVIEDASIVVEPVGAATGDTSAPSDSAPAAPAAPAASIQADTVVSSQTPAADAAVQDQAPAAATDGVPAA